MTDPHTMKSARLLPILLLVVSISVCAQQDVPTAKEPAEQDPATTLKVDVKLVNVFVSVNDEHGAPVASLRKEDFRLLEDGKEQKISVFERDSALPLSIVMAVDTSLSTKKDLPLEIASARRFVRAILRPIDSLSLYQFSEVVNELVPFTSDLRQIDRGLVRVHSGSATALYDAIYVTADEVLSHDEMRRGVTDEQVTRRAIILLTDGVDNASSRKLDEAIDRAWRAGVIIYSIGIGDRFRFEGVREDILRRLGEETGGRAYFPRGADDLLQDFRQIEAEMRSQYLVAYAPSNSTHDGRFRRVEVRVNARLDARIIHRRGYYAATEDVRK